MLRKILVSGTVLKTQLTQKTPRLRTQAKNNVTGDCFSDFHVKWGSPYLLISSLLSPATLLKKDLSKVWVILLLTFVLAVEKSVCHTTTFNLHIIFWKTF